MFYQTFREKKKPGGRKKNVPKGPRFDTAVYDEMMKHHRPMPGTFGAANLTAPQPKNPIELPTFNAYKSMFRHIYNVQIQQDCQAAAWDRIWTINVRGLEKIVKERKPMNKKMNYREKVDFEFAPYSIVQHYPNMEKHFWDDSANTHGKRNVGAYLRHRYCLLHLTSGILRAESLHRAELSDFLHVYAPKKDTDIHPMMIMVNQIAQGKTNHGRLLYGRATRHRNVELCCIGALSFYLMYRFFVTNEFSDFTAADWLDNSKWFDVKLLVDVNPSASYSHVMKNDSYGDHIKRIMTLLRIVSNVILYLGRKLGTKIMEFFEAEDSEIKKLGNWNPGILDTHYSAKLTLWPIRTMAGYPNETRYYVNHRASVEPPEGLLKLTPLGRWVYSARDGAFAADTDNRHQTAHHVLAFFCELNKVFL